MPADFATVLGKIPSGLFILTAYDSEGRETGMLASWVQQAAFEPPAVTVAVNRQRFLHDSLQPGAHVALSVVGETQKQFLSHFGRGFAVGEPAFEGIEIDHTPAGLPILRDALAWLGGVVQEKVTAGDHSILLVTVTSAQANAVLTTERPFVHLRKNGLSY